ncbi:hypothetical protein MASR1M107_11550 [Ignavibacteriales bacterium]
MEKRVYRSRKERMIGGVAGGIAEYFEVDPVIVRFAFIALTLFNGVGLVLYIVGLIIIPEQVMRIEVSSENSIPYAVPPVTTNSDRKGKFTVFLGVALIIAGILFGLDNFIPQFDMFDAFPAILVLLGVWIIVSGKNKRQGERNETE